VVSRRATLLAPASKGVNGLITTCTVNFRERKAHESGPPVYAQSTGYEAKAEFFPPKEAVVDRLLSNGDPPLVKLIVVRSNPIERSGLVSYTSWPICMQTMVMMTAGYILYQVRVKFLTRSVHSIWIRTER